MMHTTTEEHEFSATTSLFDATAAFDSVFNSLEKKAENNGFTYQIPDTFKVEITRGSPVVGGYIAKATATYAKIVLVEDVDQPNEGDMDGEREARGPEEKDYTDIEAF